MSLLHLPSPPVCHFEHGRCPKPAVGALAWLPMPTHLSGLGPEPRPGPFAHACWTHGVIEGASGVAEFIVWTPAVARQVRLRGPLCWRCGTSVSHWRTTFCAECVTVLAQGIRTRRRR